MVSESLSGFYEPENDIWGEPQTYKGLNFYPIKITEAKLKELFFQLICIPKRYIQDVQIIKMSYLKFLIHAGFMVTGKEQDEYLANLSEFLGAITRSENVELDYNREDYPKKMEEARWHLVVEDVKINESDFDIVREIILVQNGLSLKYIEDYNPELEEKLNIKNGAYSKFSFEDQVFVLTSFLNKVPEDIKGYTLYQFKKHLARVLAIQEYSLYRPLEASGQIKLENGQKINNFYHLSDGDGRYDSILINKEEFVKKSGFLNDSSIKQISRKN